MKKIISIFSFLFLIGFSFATTTYHTNTENGKKYQVMKVVLDGKSKIVVPALEKGAKSLEGLMKDVGGIHAINGGFFCPDEAAYNWCGRGTTDGLRVSNGILYSKYNKSIAFNKAVFGFDKIGTPLMVSNKGSYAQDPEIDNIYNGMMMPVLVKDGINVAVLNTEMNSDGKQKVAGNKTFICSTKDNSTIYMGFVDGVTFSSLADYIIKTFSCYNAIQLDNGGSKSMIHDGKYVTVPGRNIMDAFVVIEEKKQEINTSDKIENSFIINSKTKSIIDNFMLITNKEWSEKYSTQEQINKYQKIVDSFTVFKFYGEQKELINYLIYLLTKRIDELK